MSWRRGRHEHADRADADAQYRLEFAPRQLAAANGFSPGDYAQPISKTRNWQIISRNLELL